MSAGVITTDLLGRLWMNERAAEIFRAADPCPVVEPDLWAEAFGLHDPITRMPLTTEQTAGFRVLHEGRVDGVLTLVLRPGEPERVLSCSGESFYDERGELAGAYLEVTDVTDTWLQRVGVVELDFIVMDCPCGGWQVDFPSTTPRTWVEETLREHMSECVVLAATRMTALTAESSNI